MNINALSGLSGVQQQNIKKTEAKLQAAIASLVSGKKTQDVANVAIASQLQAETSSLKQVSNNIAQTLSLTQVANGALSKSQEIVDRLEVLAQQSVNPTTNAENRKQIDQEFQSLIRELDRQVSNTQFNGQNLLDGTLSGENSLSLNRLLATADTESDSNLDISNLSSSVLFQGQTLNVLTADGATQALDAIRTARPQISQARASVGSFEQTLNYAAASIDSAIFNQEAARSLLSDADFLDVASESQQSQVQRNAQLSLAAQGNRLPASLLQLIA